MGIEKHLEGQNGDCDGRKENSNVISRGGEEQDGIHDGRRESWTEIRVGRKGVKTVGMEGAQ